VVCLAAGVSQREEDKGYEEASGKTVGALSSHAVCRTGSAQGKTWPWLKYIRIYIQKYIFINKVLVG
jgi:hypothetical protein